MNEKPFLLTRVGLIPSFSVVRPFVLHHSVSSRPRLLVTSPPRIGCLALKSPTIIVFWPKGNSLCKLFKHRLQVDYKVAGLHNKYFYKTLSQFD